jgi:hypothetical protein
MDFAAIHKAGPHSCNADWFMSSPYWKAFQGTECYIRPNPNRSSRDFFLEEVITRAPIRPNRPDRPIINNNNRGPVGPALTATRNINNFHDSPPPPDVRVGRRNFFDQPRRPTFNPNRNNNNIIPENNRNNNINPDNIRNINNNGLPRLPVNTSPARGRDRFAEPPGPPPAPSNTFNNNGGRVPWTAFNNASSSEPSIFRAIPDNDRGFRRGINNGVRFPGPIEESDGGFFAPPGPSLTREIPGRSNSNNNFERGQPNNNNFNPNVNLFPSNNNDNNNRRRQEQPSRFENFNINSNVRTVASPVNTNSFPRPDSREFRDAPPFLRNNNNNLNNEELPPLSHEPGRHGRRFIPADNPPPSRPSFVNNNNNNNNRDTGPPLGLPALRPNAPRPPPNNPITPIVNNNVRQAPPTGLVPASCLPCLCAASSGCDLNKKCVGDFCGPYLISWQYWTDGGSPGGDFVTCALNRACSEEAIQGYMRKWTRDCNGDGIVDCDDFAAIHKLGPHQCRSDSIQGTPYWREYEKCEAHVRGVGGSLGSSSTAVTDLRRPERGFNAEPNSINSLNSNGLSSNNLPRINGFNRNDGDSFNPSGLEPVPPPLFFQPPTTPRPTLDLPLITPRRRLYPPSIEAREDIHNNNTLDSVGEKPPVIDMSNECMECICEAASACDLNAKCTGLPLDETGRHCGPYQLDGNYWRLGGRMGGDFERCVSDKECAEQTVTRFIRRMSFDCNEDGVIDCLDYAAIHKAGPKSCNSQWLLESKFWNSFEQCYGFSRRR